MDLFTEENLQNLISFQDETCVSIYLPMRRSGAEVQQNPIRLKNAIQDIEQQMTERGASKQAADNFLKPLRTLLDDRPFWKEQSDGLALFLTGDGIQHLHRLPISFEPLFVVGERFHVKPLLRLFSGDGRFYILALSQKRIRLLQGTHFTIKELELEGVSEGLAEVLFYDQPQQHLQQHTGARADTGQNAIHHGHGEAVDEKDAIKRYFQRVAEELEPFLAGGEDPLVLAGVDYLLPLYREAASNPHLIDEAITGNPDNMEPSELHARAWPLVEEYFNAPGEAAVRQFEQLSVSSQQAASDIEEVVAAAHYGRVDTLFVALGTRQWGNFDPDTSEVMVLDKDVPGSEDLLDRAAVETIKNGGKVFAVSPADVPSDTDVAAILRY